MDYNNPIVPLFLLKSFSILETANTDIVCWSENGDSFIVLDPERFGSEVIPTHFKHNKFSSFVRQLNFYGFRKVKGKLNVVGLSEQHSWEFKHPYFQRGQPELLSEIRRSSLHNEEPPPPVVITQRAPESELVAGLRRHVAQLSQRMDVLEKTVDQMQDTITRYQDVNPLPSLKPSLALAPTVEPVDEFACLEELNPLEELGTMDMDEETDKDEEDDAMGWDIGDDELLTTFLGDMNDTLPPPLPPVARALKRRRSIDDLSAMLNEPPRQVCRTEESSDGSSTRSERYNDPVLVQAVANAVSLHTLTTEAGAAVSYDQYEAAVAAILSCAGMSHAQALATSSAVLAQTQATRANERRPALMLANVLQQFAAM